MKTIKILICLIFFSSSLIYSESNNKLKTIELKMINLYGLFNDGINLSKRSINEAQKKLKTISKSDFKSLPIEKQSILLSILIQIDSLIQIEAQSVTIRSSIAAFLNKFYLFFADDLIELYKDSQKYKIFLFSTSVSCKCTLTRCTNYEKTLYELNYKYKNEFECLTIDSYLRKDIKERFSVGYIPTIVLINPDNKEIKRIEVDGKMEDLVKLIKE